MQKNYLSIQYLRALAALLVIFHHGRNAHSWLYNPFENFLSGNAGVDVFFVISGFIMYTAAREEKPFEFMRRRFVRVVPLYWCATVVYFIYKRKLGIVHASSEEWLHFFKSIFFVPHYSLTHPDNIWPMLIPGWTLNYEMFFYLIFALGLATGRLMTTVICSLVILVAGGFLFPFSNALWKTYTSTMLLEFLAGMLIARFRVIVPDWAAWLFIAAFGIAIIANLPFYNRAFYWGIPAALLIIGAISLEQRGRIGEWKTLHLLGNASYSIYLFQYFGLNIAEKVARRLPFSGIWQFLVMMGTALSVAVLIGLVIHLAVEKPLSKLLRRNLFKSPSGNVPRHALAKD